MSRRTSPHVLCFAPYTDWSIHSTREVTILQALRLRGCTVSYVACDGAFSDCDLLQESMGAPKQKPANACLVCQANAATKLAAWGMPYRWLGRWMRPEDRAAAAAWVQGLKPPDYRTAMYGDWEIGAWVRSSVHTHLRMGDLDLDDAHVRAVFGSYLYSGLLACFALTRLLDEERPDAQLLFNGRMAPARVAFELARRRGIRTLCEERAILPGRLMLYDNEHCLGLDSVESLWRAWQDRPLTAAEIDAIGGVLTDRWRGRATDVSVFSAGLDAGDAVAQLGLDRNRPIWALFTSSIDESADVDDGRRFPTQQAWIEATVEYVARRPQVQLAIRVHPNVGSAKSLGRSAQDAAFYAGLGARLPANVKLVASDSPVSSYGLAAAADVGLVWYSSIGLEMAAMGKRVLRAAAYWLGVCDFIPTFAQPADYDAFLEHHARAATDSERRAIAVAAWRFAHLWYIRQSLAFPLVRQPKWYVGEMAYTSAGALQPGRDAVLDHICRVFIDGAPLHALDDPAGGAGRDASAEAERIRAAISAVVPA
ncbi:MAG: hypothetical protein SFV21_12100 [Rhodospirillaceae bacterium]|nr:hypothetical protein [Rhodospirillaceae bacterium]